MLNSLIELKDSVIKKYGPLLGYAILIVGALLALSVLGFLIRAFFSVAIGLIIACLILFGVYKISELIKANKQGTK